MNRLATVLAATALTLGCGGGAFSPSGASGTYTLRLVSGMTLPVADFGRFEIDTLKSRSITLNENETWTSTLRGTSTDGSTTITETFSGTFTLIEPNTIRFTAEGDVFTAVIDGNRITVSSNDLDLVFEK